MKLLGGRIVLALDALLFAGFGALYCVMPVSMAASVGVTLTNTAAIIDVQGLYGGLEIGLGLFLAYCARSAERAPLGLLGGALALCSIAITRLIAMARFGMPDASVAMLVGLDLLGAVLNLAFYLRARTR